MTDPMTTERLAEIEACEDAARPGPWILRDALEGDGFPGNLWVLNTDPTDEDYDHDVEVRVGDRAVGAFIEMARTAVPELLAEMKRLSASHVRALELADETKLTLFRERSQALTERNEAREIARRLIDRKNVDQDNAEHLGLGTLPGWLAAHNEGN